MGSRQVRGSIATLAVLAMIILGMAGGLFAAHKYDDAQLTPKRALDLAGGTQIILTPKVNEGGKEIDQLALNQAIEIMRKRVDSTGVSEAQLSSQGGRNIVVELPGNPEDQKATRDLVRQSAQMNFRAVLAVEAQRPPAGSLLDPRRPIWSKPVEPEPKEDESTDGTQPQPSATSGAEKSDKDAADKDSTKTKNATATPSATGATTSGADATATSEPTQTSAGRPFPLGESTQSATATPSGTASSTAPTGSATTTGTESPSASPSGSDASASPSESGTPSTSPSTGSTETNPAKPAASPLEAAPKAVRDKFAKLDCNDFKNFTGGNEQPADEYIATCGSDGGVKFLLAPVEVRGSSIKSARAGLETNSQGQQINRWAVFTEFNDEGAENLKTLTNRITPLQAPFNQFAIVLDGLVLSAPRSQSAIPDGRSMITGDYTAETSKELANKLKFGALPMTFTVESENQISALLGSEQLEKGLLAGAIGLLLVVVYSLFQYRLLGLVVVASLVVAGLMTYLAIVLLGYYKGYRLSLPGVAGLIVAIGITADSFIVYFERIRDELRDGRPLVSAVQAAWKRARQTIVVSDAIHFLAAGILFVLAVGGVQGFAFTLGLTTLIDLIMIVMFTHPIIELLSRTKTFSDGHPMSGLSEAALTSPTGYVGRGRVVDPADRQVDDGLTLAERRAKRAAEEAENSDSSDKGDASGKSGKSGKAESTEDKEA